MMKRRIRSVRSPKMLKKTMMIKDIRLWVRPRSCPNHRIRLRRKRMLVIRRAFRQKTPSPYSLTVAVRKKVYRHGSRIKPTVRKKVCPHASKKNCCLRRLHCLNESSSRKRNLRPNQRETRMLSDHSCRRLRLCYQIEASSRQERIRRQQWSR